MPSQLNPGKVYLTSGSTLAKLQKRQDDLWAGKNIQRGPNIRIRNGGSAGLSIAAKAPSLAGVIKASAAFSFQIILTPITESTTQYKGSFFPGLINGFIYATVGGVPMWQLVPFTNPDSSISYVRPSITVTKGDRMYLKADVTAGIITDVSILSDASNTPDTDSVANYTIGTCDPTTGAVSQTLRNNLSYEATAALYSASGRLIHHIWEVAP